MKRMLWMGICLAAAVAFSSPAVEGAESGGVVIDAASFPDDFLRERVLRLVDTNQDGVLQQAEAAAVKEMAVDKFLDADDQYDEENPSAELHYYTKDEYTFDCKGLELFENLSELKLYLYDDGLKVEDERYVTKIKNMDCLYKMKSLSTLYVDNIGLKSFDCSKFPHLQNLQLTELPNLKSISFKGAKEIKQIQLRNLPAMKTLNVSELSTLETLTLLDVDVKKLSFGKKNKSIQTLELGGNGYGKLQELNLSKLTGLKDLNISQYRNLKFPNLKNNKKLEKLSVNECAKFTKIAPSQSKNLSVVFVWSCKNLKTLDLSKNAKLNLLLIDGAKVKTLRLSAKNKLETLRYTNAGLKKFDIKNINKNTLKDLDLTQNKLKKINLSKYKKLESVHVDKGVKTIGWEQEES